LSVFRNYELNTGRLQRSQDLLDHLNGVQGLNPPANIQAQNFRTFENIIRGYKEFIV